MGKVWLVVLTIAAAGAGIWAFSGVVQAAVGAAKALFWGLIALIALVAGGMLFAKEKISK